MQINYKDRRPMFPARAAEVIDTFLSNPDYTKLALGNDNQRRELTKIIVEQLEFEDPSAGFVTKSASPTRPVSKDAIGIVVDGKLHCWDWQNGTTRLRSVQEGDLALEIFDQNPLPVVGVNHLGVQVNQPQTPAPATGTPLPPLADNREISEKLDRVVDLLGSVVTLIAQVAGGVDAIARTQQAEAVVLGNTAANVAEALKIARSIDTTTQHQAGEAERTSTNVHETSVRVGEVVAGLAPLLNLLAALKGGKK